MCSSCAGMDTGWGNFGPAHLGDVQIACDASGKLVAYEYHGWQNNWSTVETSEQLALGTPAGESTGSVAQEVSPFNLGAMYEIPNMQLVNHRVDGVPASFKTSNLRSPLDLSFSFASEQTIDEVALLAGRDPYEFRKRNIKDERWLGVLEAVAQAAQWTPRRGERSSAKVVTGRGIALASVSHTQNMAERIAKCVPSAMPRPVTTFALGRSAVRGVHCAACATASNTPSQRVSSLMLRLRNS